MAKHFDYVPSSYKFVHTEALPNHYALFKNFLDCYEVEYVDVPSHSSLVNNEFTIVFRVKFETIERAVKFCIEANPPYVELFEMYPLGDGSFVGRIWFA